VVPIFIVKYKMPDMEKRCIEAVEQNTEPGTYVLQIVDNGRENRNLSTVWNQMIDNAAPIWKHDPEPMGVLLNTDCFVTPGWLSRMVEVAHMDERIGFVGPTTNNCGSHQKVPDGYDPQSQAGRVSVDVHLSGFCLLFKRACWEEAGRFCEDAPFYGQESALIEAAWKKGWHTVLAWDVWVEHLGGASAKAADRRGELDRNLERKKGAQWFHGFKAGLSKDML